ncbi:MAG TPA: F0F1 ATP synthase subunit A [Crenotrichaceae bacterium]|nr:F0F1 ATP synthase subunit A [Crenotrichaceae bacterium]
MHLSPDELILWQYGFFKLNNTIVTTWILMAVLVIVSIRITSHLTTDTDISRQQNALEVIILTICSQIKEVGIQKPRQYLGFIGTIFIFIATANLFTIFPGYEPPTGSVSTTFALAICVFIASPVYGIAERGIVDYLKSYLQPTPIMLPFNIISEISRTFALAIRLFGNIMSGEMILAILLVITPFIFPIVMSLLGLLTGVVQAYIFTILATVYIAAATSDSEIT